MSTQMAEQSIRLGEGFTCGEVRGGNGVTHTRMDLPGLQGVLYSRPCSGAHGGDIHYLSVCGSGLMSRVCLADVAGHGETVSAIGREIHDHLRRSVDVVDERKVLSRFNDRLNKQDQRAMTTAVLVTYYPPRRRLTVCYAGHPVGWLYRADSRQWVSLQSETSRPQHRPAFVDIPLGVGFTPEFTRHRFTVARGDRILLITDGVLETASPEEHQFDRQGIEDLLSATGGNCEDVAGRLLTALHAHAGTDELAHDDVTFFLGEFGDGPPGPAIWHVVKNRLLNRASR